MPPAPPSDFLLSVVVPCHNEQENLLPLYEALTASLREVKRYEIILIDDGSTDLTLTHIRALADRDPRVRFASFTRNFGHQAAIKAGIDASRGDCVVMLDADLQHPPALIPRMIELWKEGNRIVYTRRETNQGYSWLKRITARGFYRVMSLLSDVPIAEDSADFRLIDKEVVDVLRPLQDNFLFLRGLLPWMGFSSTSVSFAVQPRHAGKTKYSLRKMISLGLNGITSFSIRPLRIASLLGGFISFLAFLYGLYAIYLRLFTVEVVPGWTSVMAAVLFIGGIQLIVIGIIGEYLGKLFIQHKNRPPYILKESRL
jgi:polyisoprenyl-phosphate glycosyltransferase